MSMRGGDFAGGMCVGDRFSTAAGDPRVISATGFRSELLRRHSMGRAANPTALCGRSAEASGDDLPVVALQASGWQVQHDAPHGRFHPGAEFHEVFAQSADLRGAKGGPCSPQPQFLVEHVGGGAQQPPQLISEEAAAAGAVDLQTVVQLFNSVLDITPSAVDRLIQMPRRFLYCNLESSGSIDQFA